VSFCTKTIFWKMSSWENKAQSYYYFRGFMFLEQVNFNIRNLCVRRPVVWYKGIPFRRNSCLHFRHFWKWEAAGALSTSVIINQTTRRHFPLDRSSQLLYEVSQDTDIASAELRTVNAVDRLAAKLLLTQKSTYTSLPLLLYATVDFSSVYPVDKHFRYVILRKQGRNWDLNTFTLTKWN
jgi:hypothetical protein